MIIRGGVYFYYSENPKIVHRIIWVKSHNDKVRVRYFSGEIETLSMHVLQSLIDDGNVTLCYENGLTLNQHLMKCIWVSPYKWKHGNCKSCKNLYEKNHVKCKYEKTT